jgi:hypothetical protein
MDERGALEMRKSYLKLTNCLAWTMVVEGDYLAMNSGKVWQEGMTNLQLQKLPLFDYFVGVAPIIKAEL